TRSTRDWSSDVCSSDLKEKERRQPRLLGGRGVEPAEGSKQAEEPGDDEVLVAGLRRVARAQKLVAAADEVERGAGAVHVFLQGEIGRASCRERLYMGER